MEQNVLVENKLRGEWSGPEFAALLTTERLQFIAKEFSTFELGIKLRVMLSLLSLPVTQLASLWEPVNEVLRSAALDSDEWVRVILALVKKRLPAEQDVLESSSQPKNEEGTGKSVEEDVKQAADKAAQSVKESSSKDLATESLHEAIRAIAKEVEASKRTWPPPGDIEAKPCMSAEFVPLEWPFLSAHLLPQDIDIEDRNRHFRPASSQTQQQGALHQSEEQQPAHIMGSAASRGSSDGQHPAPSAMSSTSNAASVSSAPQDSIPKDVPEGMQKILRDPENDKLDSEARRKIIEFYTNKHSPVRPKKGVLAILLKETRSLEGTDVLVTQVNLKLDYSTGTAKRATSRKKYKMQ